MLESRLYCRDQDDRINQTIDEQWSDTRGELARWRAFRDALKLHDPDLGSLGVTAKIEELDLKIAYLAGIAAFAELPNDQMRVVPHARTTGSLADRRSHFRANQTATPTRNVIGFATFAGAVAS